MLPIVPRMQTRPIVELAMSAFSRRDGRSRFKSDRPGKELVRRVARPHG